jgi:hypothetical protein
MKPVAAVLALALLLPVVHARQARPDFSGSWKMDESRSASAAQAGFSGPVTWHITQAAGQMKVEIQRAGRSYTLTYTIDDARPRGADSSGAGSPGYRGHWDGDALITETTQTIQGQTVTTREVRTLAGGGQEMIVDRTVNVHHGYTVRGAQSSSVARDTFIRAAP